MGSVLDFDSSKLDMVLQEYGIKQAWINILATHLNGLDDFAYILDSDEFAEAAILNEDLIAELSIGDIGVLYEYSVASVDAESRKSNGQFFTPDDVAKFMVSFVSEFPEGIWLDPCSGIGNLSWHLVVAQENPELFLLNNTVLSDKDELALLIARTLFTKSFQNEHKNLFHEAAHCFVCFDFLSVADSGSATLLANDQDLGAIPSHDFVIVNPPYLATQRDARFETARSADLYSYFLENIIKTSKGFISITPQSFTNASKFADLRSLLLRSYSNLRIFNFDNVPGNIFRGIKFGSKNSNNANSIRAAITVALPIEGKCQITSLMRWRSAEREKLFLEVHKFLSDVPLSEAFFPKVSAVMRDLYLELLQKPTLGSICTSKRTEFSLFVPSSPRYFIPALKSEVKRSSQHEIFFQNKKDRDFAYMIINSSLMYWWWRVRDGGMTLSQETLFSLPMPKFKINARLIKMLEESEQVNKVYKQNAGEAQENVKHPTSLLLALNHAIMPEYAERLMSTHENSEFAQVQYLSN